MSVNVGLNYHIYNTNFLFKKFTKFCLNVCCHWTVYLERWGPFIKDDINFLGFLIPSPLSKFMTWSFLYRDGSNELSTYHTPKSIHGVPKQLVTFSKKPVKKIFSLLGGKIEFHLPYNFSIQNKSEFSLLIVVTEYWSDFSHFWKKCALIFFLFWWKLFYYLVILVTIIRHMYLHKFINGSTFFVIWIQG